MKTSVGLSLPEYLFNTSHTVIIVGAGLAGCATAHALVKRGYSCRIYDKHVSIAHATSALPAAVIRPAISGDEFFRSYFDYAFDLCCESLDKNLFTQCGSLELTNTNHHTHGNALKNIPNNVQGVDADTDNNEFDHNNGAIYSGTYKSKFVTATTASKLAGVKLDTSAIHIEKAGFISPQLLCEHWLKHQAIEFHSATAVDALRRTEHGWQLLSESGAVIDESQIVVLATAEHTDNFDVTAELPLQKVVGQIDLLEHQELQLRCIINGNGYLLPTDDGIWSGSTHRSSAHRSSASSSGTAHGVLQADTRSNTAKAKNMVPALSSVGLPLASFAAVRTFTPDRLPIVGALHDAFWYQQNYADLKHGKPAKSYPQPRFQRGLYLAAGLGSRGATQALLIGELIGDLISGDQKADNPGNQLRQKLLRTLHPARFLIRALRRGR